MKKSIILVLALVLCITSVSAFAAGSPVAQQMFGGIDTENIESRTDGLTFEKTITSANKDFTNRYTEIRKGSDNATDKVVPVDKDANSLEKADDGKKTTNYAIVPFPGYAIADSVTEEVGKFIIPITLPVKEFLSENIDKIEFYFLYEKDETIYSFLIDDWFIISTGKNTYGILALVPMPILRAAQTYPACLDFEIAK